ncbi:MAG: DegT/DnrJ/EryC1/StrS family aminotransferase [Rhodospirillaceae bacterium]|nr:DegT/DnrJ/EryC1/StrS family aminotransferase [Rhodospirillaceae bacterium]
MVPFLDLKAQYHSIKDEADAAVLKIMESCQFALGEEVATFEHKFAEYCQTRHAVAVNSGTSALHLSLLAAGVGPGDEVITVAMTFVATVAAIDYSGAKAVLVDVDPKTWTMDANQLEAAITPKTKAIIPVHLHGRVADMDAINAIADKHGLVVIEDAAQAHGAEYKGRRAGSLSRAGCFSFYPGKNLGAYGEGGAVVTDDEELANMVRVLRDWGQKGKYNHVHKGFNARMDGFQGAILNVKMGRIEDWTDARRAHAALYDKLLAGSGFGLPIQSNDCRHVYHVYALCTPDREAMQAHLTEQGIQSGIHYPIPVHLQPAYADLGGKKGDFPVSERLANEFVSLPMYAELSTDQIELVAAGVNSV